VPVTVDTLGEEFLILEHCRAQEYTELSEPRDVAAANRLVEKGHLELSFVRGPKRFYSVTKCGAVVRADQL